VCVCGEGGSEEGRGEGGGPLVDDLVADHDLDEGGLVDVVGLESLEAVGAGPLAVTRHAVEVNHAVGLGGVREGHPHRLQLPLGRLVAMVIGTATAMVIGTATAMVIETATAMVIGTAGRNDFTESNHSTTNSPLHSSLSRSITISFMHSHGKEEMPVRDHSCGSCCHRSLLLLFPWLLLWLCLMGSGSAHLSQVLDLQMMRRRKMEWRIHLERKVFG
jgi:hypothetical protein